MRSYADGATEEEKAKKSGQQKWGLFETNYQRSQGKSLDQSLHEIDEFSKHGVMSGSVAMDSGRKPGSGAAGAAAPAGGARGGFGGPGSSGGAGAGGFGAPGGAGGFSAKPDGFGPAGSGSGPAAFGPGGAAGAAFLAQHSQQQQKKFIPEAKGGVGKPIP